MFETENSMWDDNYHGEYYIYRESSFPCDLTDCKYQVSNSISVLL